MSRSKLAVCLALVLVGALAIWRLMPHSKPTPVADDWPSSPDGLEWQFEYDDAGRPKLLSGPGGKTTSFAYEFHETPAGTPQRLKRVTRTTRNGALVEEFDRAGRRTSMRDAGGLVKYGYDDFGRLATVEREGAPCSGIRARVLVSIERAISSVTQRTLWFNIAPEIILS